MAAPKVVKVCIKCNAHCVNEIWYEVGKEPSHKPLYQHGLCPDCKGEAKERGMYDK